MTILDGNWNYQIDQGKIYTSGKKAGWIWHSDETDHIETFWFPLTWLDNAYWMFSQVTKREKQLKRDICWQHNLNETVTLHWNYIFDNFL